MISVNKPLLQVRDVYRDYILPGKQVLKAVNGVSLDLDEGECLAVVGESGCGKSTLVRMIARIDPVTKGSILFAGEAVDNLQGEPLRRLRMRMQVIFQDPSTVFSPRMKIGGFLCEPFINYNILNKKEAMVKARSVLESVELPSDYISRFPHQLSGGELQRVAIARAMSIDPLLLICDEPTSALDVSIQSHIVGLLDHMRREYGVAMLFISHDLALVSNISDRVAVMYLGYILESLPSDRLVREARHPYTMALLQAVFHVDKERGERIAEIEGIPPSSVQLPPGCPYCWNCPSARDLCRQAIPPLREIAPGHMIACHTL